MKKILSWVSLLLTLAVLAGCSNAPAGKAPELLDPVGVTIATATAQRDTVYTIKTYAAEIVPHVEELYFEVDGKLDEFLVNLGDTVEEGQALATLQVESYQKQIDALEDETYYTSQLGKYTDRELSAQIEIAKVQLEKLRAEGASLYDCSLKELEVKKLEQQLEQAQQLRNMELGYKYSTITSLQEKVENNKLLAPFSGRVVYIKEMASGSSVNGYTTVICLADESRLTLQTNFLSKADLDSADRVYAKVLDKEYDITYQPYDETEYVTMLLSGKKMKTYFSVDDPEGTLESGQYAVIVSMFDYKENVLTIPVNALLWDKEGRHVYKLVDGHRIRCSVTVGTITDTKIEILEGLSEGDVICVSE